MNCTGLETAATAGLALAPTGTRAATLAVGNAGARDDGFARVLAGQAQVLADSDVTPRAPASLASDRAADALAAAVAAALPSGTPTGTTDLTADTGRVRRPPVSARRETPGGDAHGHGTASHLGLRAHAPRPSGQTTGTPAAPGLAADPGDATAPAARGGHAVAAAAVESAATATRAGTSRPITAAAPLEALLAGLTAAVQTTSATLGLPDAVPQRGHATSGRTLGVTPPRAPATRTAAVVTAARELAAGSDDPAAGTASELAASTAPDLLAAQLPTRAVRGTSARDGAAGLGPGAQGLAVEGPVASTPAADAAALGPSKALVQTLEQLAVHWEEGGSGGARTAQVNVRLDPAGWGSVELGVRMQSGVVQLVVRCDSERTARALRGEATALRKALAGSGLELDHYDVETLPDGLRASQGSGDSTDDSSGGAFDERAPY